VHHGWVGVAHLLVRRTLTSATMLPSASSGRSARAGRHRAGGCCCGGTGCVRGGGGAVSADIAAGWGRVLRRLAHHKWTAAGAGGVGGVDAFVSCGLP
jgi:hypothetical protein